LRFCAARSGDSDARPRFGYGSRPARPVTVEAPTRPSVGWHLARLGFAGSTHQAFLDRRLIGWVLRIVPPRHRRSLALRILSLSPHYFIYQWSRYPPDWSRTRVLEAEFARNTDSRRQIAEEILAPMISRDAVVLDFGCGAGFLAAHIHGLVEQVVAVDVSSGAVACARVLNPGPTYRVNRAGDLPVRDASIDCVYSIAVFQHIDVAEWPRYLADLWRALRPGGHGVCQVAIAEHDPVVYHERPRMRGRYSLRFEERPSAEVAASLRDAGFVDVQITSVGRAASIDDDVGDGFLATFRKPG